MGSLKYPSICYVSSHYYSSKEEFEKVQPKDNYDYYYFSDLSYRTRVTTSKISMASSTNTKNIYDEFTDEDWKIVDKCYNKDFTNPRSRYDSYTILKGKKAKNNFREDYLNSKELK